MPSAIAPQTAPIGATDAELVARALARDETAVRAIIRANNRRLYRLARGILRNDGEAEDVVQETYVRAFTHLAEFRGEFQPVDLAVADRDERGARPAAPRAAIGRIVLAAARHAGSADHPVSPDVRRRRSGKIHGPARNPACRRGRDRRTARAVPHRLHHARGRGHECGGDRRNPRPQAGDGEDAAAPRPRHAARQCREARSAPSSWTRSPSPAAAATG